ncbi:MAG: CPBP family intramembrane metalloprotease [Clostridium sp.]|nr:CPBP family intramembrane metalloprotease [Acetatifactor muris]MCM1526780.1 CPBP family intramembrane metalloprotease [Bacteroides sp.]MCM1562760.1 CPBP family intramembrane metalloprotease [Clostridium sp.]
MDECKQAKKTFSRLGWSYIAGTAVIYLFQAVGVGMIYILRPELMNSMVVQLLLSGITVYAIGLPLILLLTWKMDTEPIPRHKMKWWQFVLALIMCYSLIYISNLLGTSLTTFIGALKGGEVENSVANIVTEGNPMLNFVLMVIVAPIAEEYVFRKVLVDRTVKYGEGMAIILSGLMFGLFHGNLNQFAYAVGLGAFFAFLYIRTGNIKITMVMHAIINFMGSIVSMKLLELLDYSALAALDPNDTDAMMELVMDNLAGWMLFFLYAMFLLAVVVTGVVLFIVFIRRMKPRPGRVQIPKGRKFNTLIVNSGMLTFCIIWVALIVVQLFT